MKLLLSALIPGLFMQHTVAQSQPQPSSGSDQSELVRSNNAFAIDLYGQLRGQSGNLFYSPASISTALAMTYAGARGDTATEMAKTLHFTLPPERLHPAMGVLLGELNSTHNGYQLRVADALWAEQDHNFLAAYLKQMEADYGSGLHRVDFRNASPAARLTINQWVAKNTENKIQDLLQPGVVDANTRLVLTNAIYFKGAWLQPFDVAQTESGDFYLTPAQTTRAQFMHRHGRFNYCAAPEAQLLEIPYQSGELSMVLLLPPAKDGLPALEKKLTASVLQQWLGKMQPAPRVELALPRFKMTQQFVLDTALGALGMRLAYDGKEADFSGMTGARDLWISSAIHKAFVDVTEEGTEAAAATAVVMRATAMPYDPTPPIVFRADHPFLFLIRDNRSGLILFLGRVADPTK